MAKISEEERSRMLAAWFHVGEEVTLTSTDSVSVITGFGERFICRGGRDSKRAGIYINLTCIRVVDKCDWSEESVDISRLVRKNFSTERETLLRTGQILQLDIKIGVLPETPFWEGDTVIFTHDQPRGCGEEAHWVITKIAYADGNHTFWLHSKLNHRIIPSPINHFAISF